MCPPLYLLNEKGAPQQIETHPKKHLSNCCHTSSVPFRGRAKERTLFTKAVPLNGKSQRGRFEYELVWQVELYMTVWRFWISGISNRRSVSLVRLFSKRKSHEIAVLRGARAYRAIFFRFGLAKAQKLLDASMDIWNSRKKQVYPRAAEGFLPCDFSVRVRGKKP